MKTKFNIPRVDAALSAADEHAWISLGYRRWRNLGYRRWRNLRAEMRQMNSAYPTMLAMLQSLETRFLETDK